MKTSALALVCIANRWVCSLSTMAVMVAVFWDFLKYNRRRDFVLEKKSVVATATMFLFFFVFYVIVVLCLGTYTVFCVL